MWLMCSPATQRVRRLSLDLSQADFENLAGAANSIFTRLSTDAAHFAAGMGKRQSARSGLHHRTWAPGRPTKSITSKLVSIARYL